MLGRFTASFLAVLAVSAPAQPLAWTTRQVDYVAKAGETKAVVRFHFRNVSSAAVTIDQVSTSCGCTVATIPRKPWILQPGEQGDVAATVDLQGKFGMIEKTLLVRMQQRTNVLRITVHLPPKSVGKTPTKFDRQSVFQGSCAICHADPLKGKTGSALYVAACEICHKPSGRASMVPSLSGLPNATGAFWRQWITTGRPGTLMPVFGRDQGGPLTSDQIDSLIRWLRQKN